MIESEGVESGVAMCCRRSLPALANVLVLPATALTDSFTEIAHFGDGFVLFGNDGFDDDGGVGIRRRRALPGAAISGALVPRISVPTRSDRP